MVFGKGKVLKHAYTRCNAIHMVDYSVYHSEKPFVIETIGENDAKRYKTLEEANVAWSKLLACGYEE